MKAKNVIACLLFCMIVLNGRVLAQQESLQGPQRMQRYVYDSEIYSNINGQGCVIKRDAGDLVYLDAALFRGEVKVEAGHVKIGAVPDNKLEVLPYLANPVLTNGLSLWLDSSRNVASDSGAVSSWLDVRDALGAAQTNFPWAALPAGVTAPTLLSSGIDFGESGSGSWLQWANTETNALRISDISTVVMAVSCENGGGCFLGDSVSSHFARGADTADGSRFFFRHGVSSSYLIQGDVYQDEKRVDALKSAPGSGPQVLSFTTRYTTGTADVTASNFGNDRNLERGGFTVYEVLVYNRVLKAAERIRVSEYLDGKWFGRSIAGDFEVHGAAELELAPTQNCALVSGRLAGSGTVVKSGAGSWVVGDADNSFAGQIVLQDGSITNASLVERSLPFAVSGDALSVVADSRGWRVADNQTAGVMEKSGNGEWLVTGVPQTGV